MQNVFTFSLASRAIVCLIMTPPIVALLLFLYTRLSYGKSYGIKTWNTTIVNPDVNDHPIPLTIHYPSDSSQKYPVMVFYHGWECEIRWYDFVWQQLVPLGVIVALPMDYIGNNQTNETLCALSQRYTLEWIKTKCNTDPKCPLHGIISTKSMAVGHSMGGGASILSASSHLDSGFNFQFKSHFDAAFIFSGCGDQHDIVEAVKSIDIPIFLFTASHDCMCPPDRTAFSYYKALPDGTCRFVADIRNGTHCGFMNAPTVHEDACHVFDSVSCPFHDHRNMNLDVQLDVVMEYLKMFVEATMGKEVDEKEMKKIEEKLGKDKENGVMLSFDADC